MLQNGAWFCSLRWLVIGALAMLGLLGWVSASVFAQYGICLQPAWPLTVSGVLLVLNVTYLVMAHMMSRSPRRAGLALQVLWLQILMDLALLTVVIHYLGSLDSYAQFMYLFHIVLACIFLPYTQSLLVTLSAMGMYLTCLSLETAGVVSSRSVLVVSSIPHQSTMTFAVLAWYFGSVVAISITVWYLTSRLANALRQREAELAASNRRLVAATEERARYMLRTTHELKAPFAAIHANTQLLLGGYCGKLPLPAVVVLEQIATRCETLSRGIKAMLQLANLRSIAQATPLPCPVDLSPLIRSCLATLKPQAAKRGIVLEDDLRPATVEVVQDYAVMIVENILSNAINYSQDGQRVFVSSRVTPGGGATVVIRDDGIGIPPEKLPRIFDDYFRTSEAVKHNNASTGLGLAIVRETALAGRIHVSVASAQSHGTVFTLDFPASPGNAETLN